MATTGWLCVEHREERSHVGTASLPIAGRPRAAVPWRHGLAALLVAVAVTLAPWTVSPVGAIGDTVVQRWMVNSSSGSPGSVYSVARAGDTVYIGGSFARISPRAPGWAALDPTTGRLATAWPEVTGTVNVVLPDGSGGWYIGGTFTAVGGVSRTNLARVLADKSVSAWDPQAIGTVDALALSGTTLYAGGGFAAVGGQPRDRLAALDTTRDTNQATAWNPGANSNVRALTVSGTTVYAGGDFTTIGGQSRGRLAALDTTRDTNQATAWGPGADGAVTALLLSGTTLYAGGTFTTIGGQSRRRLAALDTTLDTNQASAWDPDANGTVRALALSGAILYAGGDFTAIGGQARNRLAALDTTVDTNQASAWDPDANGTVRALAVSGAIVYAGGDFISVGGQSRRRLAALDGTLDTSQATVWDPSADASVRTVALSGATVHAGGDFTSIGGVARANLAALDATGVTAWNPGASSTVWSLALSGATLYAGGDFTTIGGQTRAHLAALDRGVDTNQATAWAPGVIGTVRALLVTGTTLYAAGDFSSAGGQARARLAALDTTVDTNQATAWNPGVDRMIYALALSGTTLYVGGDFATIGGQARARLAALDTTVDTNQATAWNPNPQAGANPNSAVRALAVSGTTLYAGGTTFTTIGGQARSNLAALDTTVDTNQATAWSPTASATVRALKVRGTTLYAVGNFTSVGGASRNRLAALDTAVDTNQATSWSPNAADGTVFNMTVDDDGADIVGTFTFMGGSPSRGYARVGLLPMAVRSVWLPNAAYGAGQHLDVAVDYTQAVTVTGVPSLTLTVGSATRTASYFSGSGTATLVFRYTVLAGDLDADGVALGNSIALNGGTIARGVTAAPLTLAGVASLADVTVDALPPAVASVAIPPDARYLTGQTLALTITFTKTVTVVTSGGTPSIALTIGAANREAAYQSGSGTAALTFGYTVRAGDLDVDGIAIASSIVLNSGTLRDAAGNDALLTLAGLPSAAAVLVNQPPPAPPAPDADPPAVAPAPASAPAPSATSVPAAPIELPIIPNEPVKLTLRLFMPQIDGWSSTVVLGTRESRAATVANSYVGNIRGVAVGSTGSPTIPGRPVAGR